MEPYAAGQENSKFSWLHAPATKIPFYFCSFLACEVPVSNIVSNGDGFAAFEKSDRARDCGWAEVHVALRCADLLMPGELLDGCPY